MCHKQWTRLLHVIWWIVFHPNITYRVKTGLSKYQISITKPCTPADIALNVCWRWLCVNWWWLIALAMCKLGQIATGFVGAGWLKWVSSISTGRDKKPVSSVFIWLSAQLHLRNRISHLSPVCNSTQCIQGYEVDKASPAHVPGLKYTTEVN